MRARVLLFLFSAGLLGCATAAPKTDYLSMPPLGTGWKVARTREQPGVQRFREFVREGETLASWSEIVSWHSLKKGPIAPPVETELDDQKAFLQELCPDLVWNVVERRGNAIVYEWRIADCKPSRPALEKLARGQGPFRPDPGVTLESFTVDQHAIALYIEGRWTVRRIVYTMKVRELAAAKREEWIRRWSDTRVETRAE